VRAEENRPRVAHVCEPLFGTLDRQLEMFGSDPVGDFDRLP
jgi:hypothetical protein